MYRALYTSMYIHLSINSHLLIKAHLEFALDTYDTAYGTAHAEQDEQK